MRLCLRIIRVPNGGVAVEEGGSDLGAANLALIRPGFKAQIKTLASDKRARDASFGQTCVCRAL